MFNDQLATMRAESDVLYSSLELGYPEGAVTLKNLDLINGENFDPAFLKLVCILLRSIYQADHNCTMLQNPNGTTATLEAGGKVYTSTTDVIAHLVEHAPRKVKVGTPAIIAAVHDDKYDPNFALLLAVCVIFHLILPPSQM